MSGRGRSQRSIDLVDAAVRILEEIQPASVRAVCYRLFTEKLIPSMDKSNTNSVGKQLVWARENDVIPWEWIVDETRKPERVNTWDNPKELLDAVVRGYRQNYWKDQPERIEVWSEKGTVRGTLAPVLDSYGVTFRVMHGYGSATGLHNAAEDSNQGTKNITVLYIGDWDPAGMHMSEIDLPDRLERYGGDIDLLRIAITYEDTIPRAAVSSFPASDKISDTRYAWFVENYGSRCFELDALSPVVLRNRVEAGIVEYLDVDAWNRCIEVEAAERDSMETFLSGYKSISMPATKYSGEAP